MWKTRDSFLLRETNSFRRDAANRIKNQKLTGNRPTRNVKNLFQSKFWSSGTHRPSPRGGMGLWLIDFRVDKYPYPYIFYFRTRNLDFSNSLDTHSPKLIRQIPPRSFSGSRTSTTNQELLRVEETIEKYHLSRFSFCELQRFLPWRSETVPSPSWLREQLVWLMHLPFAPEHWMLPYPLINRAWTVALPDQTRDLLSVRHCWIRGKPMRTTLLQFTLAYRNEVCCWKTWLTLVR